MSGVEVVRDGDFLAVLARREGQATKAAEALAAAVSWSAGVELPDPDDIDGWLRTTDAETNLIRTEGARHDDGSATVAVISRARIGLPLPSGSAVTHSRNGVPAQRVSKLSSRNTAATVRTASALMVSMSGASTPNGSSVVTPF